MICFPCVTQCPTWDLEGNLFCSVVLKAFSMLINSDPCLCSLGASPQRRLHRSTSWAFSSPQSPKHFPTLRNSPFWSLLYCSVPATTSAFKDKWQDDRDEKGMWIFLMLLRPQSGQRKRVSIYYSFMHITSCYCCSVTAGLPCGWGRTECNTNKKSGEFSPPSPIVGSPFIFYWSEIEDLFWTFFWLYLVHSSRFWTVFELRLEKPKWEGK